MKSRRGPERKQERARTWRWQQRSPAGHEMEGKKVGTHKTGVSVGGRSVGEPEAGGGSTQDVGRLAQPPGNERSPLPVPRGASSGATSGSASPQPAAGGALLSHLHVH